MNEETIKDNYRNLPSEELVKIAQNIDDEYEELAVQVAKSELGKRGITKIPEVELSHPVRPEQEFDSLHSKVIRVYSDELLAEMARLKLEAENIRAFIWKDDCGSWRPWWQPITGIRLVVREDKAEEAEEILKLFEADSTT